MHDRKVAETSRDAKGELKKRIRRRTKTVKPLLGLDNVLRQTTTEGLISFKVDRNEDGTWKQSPFKVRRLNLATDMGANIVCQDHFLAYKRAINIHTDFDSSHGSNCDQKATLKATGLWQHVVLFTSALNSVHGSALSPARLHQLREAAMDYLDRVDLSLCPLFLSVAPGIIKEMGLEVDETANNVAEESFVCP